MTDCDWLLGVLADGEEHELSDIIRRSQDERGHGLTVHSRVAQLRPLLEPEGKTIIQRSTRANGRVRSFYRLAALAQPDSCSSHTSTDGSAHRGAGGRESGDANAGELSLFEVPESARGAYSEAA